ncbi:MAG: hypothetical protein ACMV1B_03510 [Prevotella sp.]
MLDEFKFISYKSRIESLKGTKKPLMDLLKELTELYGHNFYSEAPLQQVSNTYYILLTNLCKSHCPAANLVTKELDKHISTNSDYCYRGLNDETVKYVDILLSHNNYSWNLKSMQEVIKLNEQMSKIPYNSNISIDFYLVDKLSSLLPMYGEDRKKIIHEYIKLKLGADAPVLQYYKLNDNPYNGTTDPQVYLDLAQAITNLKEIT